jgi:hypothetical protein
MTTRITPGVGANLLGQHAAERNQDATAYVGNLDAQVHASFFTSFPFSQLLRLPHSLLPVQGLLAGSALKLHMKKSKLLEQ